MQQFPNFRQPALGIQDAAMLPAQSNVNMLVQRAVAAQAAYVPTTQTFDSTTSSTQLNATVASASGGSIRSLMIPTGLEGFVQIVPASQIPCSSCGQNGTCSSCQTRQGSSAGMAIFGGAGISLSHCGCGCNRTVADEVVIDEENSNGIDDDGAELVVATARTAAKASAVPAAATTATATVPVVTVPAAVETAAAPAAPTANIQYVTYNA